MQTWNPQKTMIGLAAAMLFALAVAQPGQAAAVNDVDIIAFTFVAPATVATQDFVDFDNLDLAPHEPRALDGCFDAGVIAPGNTARADLSDCGDVIQYRCEIHTFMTGSITKA